MRHKLPLLLLLPLAGLLTGCPVTQEQQTPVEPVRLKAKGHPYWIYVPSNYTAEREWPLVVSLHGTFGFDSENDQVREWKRLAEDNGFIAVAPACRSVQGILPVAKGLWYKDLEADERAILAVMDEVQAKYRIGTCQVQPKSGHGRATSRPAVMLTGFSAGGYPMYYVGIRNPQRFGMLVGRSCNSDVGMFEKLELTDESRQLPIHIFWGRDDMALSKYCWNAVEWLSNHGFKNLDWEQIKGGHNRHPDVAYRVFRKMLPKEMLVQ